jgi:hypothetical protein
LPAKTSRLSPRYDGKSGRQGPEGRIAGSTSY